MGTKISCKSDGFQSWRINSSCSIQRSLPHWVKGFVATRTGTPGLCWYRGANKTLGKQTDTFLPYLFSLGSRHKVIPVGNCLLFRGTSAIGWKPAEVSNGQPI